MDLILYAIPFFFLMILIELAYGAWRGRNTYRLNDTINSLSMGSLSRLQSLVILGFSGVIYEWTVTHYQFSQLPDTEIWVWISCFIGYDFAYYWKHRFGHEVALFWGSHVAHHQSEDYNLATALRQTSIDFYGFLFYLPFFILGYPAEILFTVVSLNLIYQFWVHTQHVPKLGPIEWVFVTPSNHRVHHARNMSYVDKNYGGVFILWDRLFGSFQNELESEPVVFGLRKPLNSWNPLWANIHVYWHLILDLIKATGLVNKLKIIFMPPGWQPEGMKTSCKNAQNPADLTAKFDPIISSFTAYYVLTQFLLTTAISLFVLINSSTLSYGVLMLAVPTFAFSLYVHGIWLESKPFGFGLELARLVSIGICSQLLFSGTLMAQLSAVWIVSSLILIFVRRVASTQKLNSPLAG
ncbi:MAG: sterol desaturase/sphingolipid hydroxylase (fatty acid hydroxylase superfamily) [Pseudohongiellaceae bacterium]|jgi:alkylglycerol monooxygenase